MLNRREVMLGAAAVAAIATLPFVPASAATQTGFDEAWWSEWMSGIDAIPHDKLSTHYQGMLRNCSPGEVAIIQRPGSLLPLEQWHNRCRQYAYRRLIRLQSGVIYADRPNEPMHHPV